MHAGKILKQFNRHDKAVVFLECTTLIAHRTGHDKLKKESERKTVNKWMRRVLVINIMFQKRFRHISWRCSAEIIN